MAYFLNDVVLDDGLSELAAVSQLDICSALPGTFAEARTTFSLADKATPSVGSPVAYSSPHGRQVVVSAITDGDVNTTGSATHWALTDGSRLLAAQTLDSPVAVTQGHKFTLDQFFVALPKAY